jgi:hypothetical protein
MMLQVFQTKEVLDCPNCWTNRHSLVFLPDNPFRFIIELLSEIAMRSHAVMLACCNVCGFGHPRSERTATIAAVPEVVV